MFAAQPFRVPWSVHEATELVHILTDFVMENFMKNMQTISFLI
jgi:hypothetical protein